MIELRWLNDPSGAQVRRLQYRLWVNHFWTAWADVPEVWSTIEQHGKDTPISVSTPNP